ncbi:hypothetical protein OGH69_09385 [Flavobacterium sp. MFBS3-15]|uniref:hypothetical protein n=1 Tax=Flavobacterium sp. MFBS3-15 TaxID=2989816 RepID=UPI002235E21A|nr:hypothetical protein [Flavobacterium sp. MFBS3-15]MCW4469176.1 hypothetical protein [Flavobacterium sp. MFBS3-15]
MKSVEINTSIIDGYFGLLDSLSPKDKLDLISKLKNSLTTKKQKKTAFKKAFGAFESNKSAEEIIEEIRGSRVSTRQIEEF